MKDIQLVGAWFSGTARDMQLVARSLKVHGYLTGQTTIRNLSLPARAARKLREIAARNLGLLRLKPRRFRASIFFQQPQYWWLSDARFNCVIPNQEWFSQNAEALLPHIDEVWCKSYEAQRVFSALGCRCRYIGFTSDDRYLPELDAARDYRKFLHIAGPSIWKGTKILVDTWLLHPEWPHLTVMTHAVLDIPPGPLPENMTIIRDFMPDEELRRLQNRCGVYIQPTEMEGFGHTLCEAMSAQAVVVTTDAAPMNELVQRDRGFLVQVGKVEKHFLGTRNFVTSRCIEDTMREILAIEVSELQRMGRRAREWYLQADSQFNELLGAAAAECLRG